ncbi:flavodoxin family protein [Desulfovibrio sp. OttesenSCG-928-O18]|nr:flavodoxin family protein [Desulfovibrio sp. OttesenSCG-928-O18]
MNIIAINGGPRKTWNTATLLHKAIEGARSKGAEVELFHLYDLTFKGCMSCFACKRRGSSSVGICAYKDGLTEIIHKIAAGGGLLLASPIYLGSVTGEMASFLERVVYMGHSYEKDVKSWFPGTVHTAFIYTMGLSARMVDNYTPLFERHQRQLGLLNGSGEYMVEANTYQFTDYADYHASAINAARKEEYRKEHFPLACDEAFRLGERLAARG